MASATRCLGLLALGAFARHGVFALEDADASEDRRPMLMRRSSSAAFEATDAGRPAQNFSLPVSTTPDPRDALNYHVEHAESTVDLIRDASRQILSFVHPHHKTGPHMGTPEVDSEPRIRPLNPVPPPWYPYDKQFMNQSMTTLFVVLSSAATKDTGLKWIMDSWATRVPRENLVVISNHLEESPSHLQHESDCPIGWHWTGECCRWSEAAIVAHRLIKASEGRLKWAFFLEDSAYVRPWAMSAVLMGKTQHAEREQDGLVLGDFACSTSRCQFGLCDGGGMAANAHALERLIAGDEHSFLERHMHKCGECGRWPTLGLTEMCAEIHVETRGFEGTYPWRLNKDCFDGSLVHNADKPYGPLMYNGISSMFQMEYLERLFEATEAPQTTVFPYQDERRRCATYQNNFQCLHGSVLDTPWDTTLEFQNCTIVD